jgi:pimeloyl-ACP methyl ester carboxylesterase
MFLPGFRSDMEGAKAAALAEHCRIQGRAFVRFDYRGHGASGGAFEDGCIGDWIDDATLILDRVVASDAVLVGSSMGGWIMLHLALRRPERVKGLVGLAAAPDFTATLLPDQLGPEGLARLALAGRIEVPSAYGEPLVITRRLIEDGNDHLLLDGPIPIRCPVHLLHGQEDPDVPWQTALRLAGRLDTGAVTVELVKDGDHRLSRDADLRRMTAAVDRVIQLATTGLPA